MLGFWAFLTLTPLAFPALPFPCEKWFPAASPVRGVVVVSHGMNLRPECMDPLAQELAAAGLEVFRASFWGHCAGQGDYLRVSAEDWRTDARRIYALASARARERRVPLYLAAYSFSGLVFQTMATELPFAKRLYLAPPFATKFWYPLARVLASWFPDYSYASRNTYCAANGRTSGRALLALDEFLEKWRKGEGQRDPAPTLVFADPDDELVSFGGLGEQVSGGAGWRLEAISNREHTLPKTYHHLIIDRPSLGAAEWARFVRQSREFFDGVQSSSR